ncbi:MAG TPA: hypothetical protein VL551_34575 [Actinospica sp.]|jgi:hypothetical protein|nr:hypothetical protein [Actinospica sp.]
MRSLIEAVRHHEAASAFLAGSCDFDLAWNGHVEPVHLASGMALEGFARDAAGGTYFFCGGGAEERPVLYADSEGGAALVAVGLSELLRLVLVAPWWRDRAAFTAEELRDEFLADSPDLEADRDRVAGLLGLELPSEEAAIGRLYEVALGIGASFELIFTPEGTAYRRLITGSPRADS